MIDLKFRLKNKTYFLRGPHMHNDHWCYTYGYIIDKCEGISIRRFNKIPHWIHRIKFRLLQLKLWWKKEQYKMCQGCGEGESKYRIVDPNCSMSDKKKKYIRCCEGCVDFYNWHFSRKEIKGWKNKRPIYSKI